MKLVIVTDVEVEGDPYRDEAAHTEFLDEVYGGIKQALGTVKCSEIKVLNIHIDDLPDR